MQKELYLNIPCLECVNLNFQSSLMQACKLLIKPNWIKFIIVEII